jgi:ADP-ribose pyrophosphatase YjhB (NUDIX family)
MNFCSHCGAPVEMKIPRGDNLPRHVCNHCGQIHYQNPKIVAGCIPEWGDKVLLCKRAIEPRRGLWTLPAGFMENKETTSEAAVRETWEEANARVQPLGLYALFNIPHISQVYLIFRAKMLDTAFGPGDESLEVDLFAEHQIPWGEIAFPVIRETLVRYFKDKSTGHFDLQVDDIFPTLAAPKAK